MRIEATVINTLFPKTPPEAGVPQWYVLHTTAGKVVGSSRIVPERGHTYTFDGDYSVYQGQQNFRFRTLSENVPDDPRALLDYACSVTKGLGPAYAAKVWAEHGAGWADRIRSRGEYDKRGLSLRETTLRLLEDRCRTKAVSQLIALGATPLIAETAYETWKDETLTLVRQNVYILSRLPGQSFKTIDDRFRERLAIPLQSPLRVKAAIEYAINHEAECNGDTVQPWTAIATNLAALKVDLNDPDISGHVLATFPSVGKVGEGLTSPTLAKHEQGIYDYISVAKDPLWTAPPLTQMLDLTLDDSQAAACLAAVSNPRVTVINGGAGCGKTTIIRIIAQSLAEANEPVAIASFAGKAAARVREATGFPASTIHSLLRYAPQSGFTAPSFDGQTSVIIDEASMVPAFLVYEIAKRNPRRLILVGDEAQLPPVGAGAPFHDLVRHGLAHTVTTCYRNAEAVYQAANAVRAGQVPSSARSEHETFTIVSMRGPTAAQRYVESILKHMDFSQDIIIAPRNGEGEDAAPATVKALNAAVMRHLGQEKVVQPGARIICLKNDPDLHVWNGTVCDVSAVDIEGTAYVTTDDGAETRLPESYLKEHVAPAYALTIHKAQGSQYRRVVVLTLARDEANGLLDRAMLYTAITRAREACVVVTDLNLFSVVNRVKDRRTVLRALLEGERQ